jgi:hypothetical protein
MMPAGPAVPLRPFCTAPPVLAIALALACGRSAPVLAAPPVPAPADSARVVELERRVEALGQEVEALQMGGAAGGVGDTVVARSRTGFAPAAAKVYGKASGVSIGGYGEILFARPDRKRQDGVRAGVPSSADVARAVVYVGNKFDDHLLFNSEIEFEHAGVFDAAGVQTDPVTGTGEAELTGEATIEFAYLEWAKQRTFGLRAGKLLVPVGLTNEMHEPPTFPSAERPAVEQVIVPTTWTAKGIGVFGDLSNGLTYRAYIVEGIDAASFDPASGIREGRQETAVALLTHPAVTARVDWSGGPGLLVGASGYSNDAWQGAQPAGAHLSPRVTLLDAHARLDWHGWKARGLYAHGHVADNEALSDALGLVDMARIGNTFWGGYLEAAYDVLSAHHPGARYGLSPFVRVERYDTQDGLAAPAQEDPALHAAATTAGVSFKPHPDVAVKLDRAWMHHDAHTGESQWNFAVGYLF